MFWSEWHCVDYGTRICYPSLIDSSSYIEGTIWNTQEAMGVSSYSPVSHISCWKGVTNLTWSLNFESDVLAEIVLCGQLEALHMLSKPHSIILIHCRNNMKHPSSNVCLFSQPSIPCPVLKGCPKSNIFKNFEGRSRLKWPHTYGLWGTGTCSLNLT